MPDTSPIDFPGLSEVINDADSYFDKFIKDGILVFRNANLTFPEQAILQIQIGKTFGWYPNTNFGKTIRYDEDHTRLTPTINNVGPDEVMLPWHLEHIYYKNPIIAGLWNMHTFNIDSSAGKTYFYNTGNLFSSLTADDQNFLRRCTCNSYSSVTKKVYAVPMVQKHWSTEQEILRLNVTPYLDKDVEDCDLLFVDDRKPTKDEINNYKKIIEDIRNQIKKDEDNRIVHKWKSGDLVIPDLFIMAHAVTGGFSGTDRVFTGIWSFQKNNESLDFYEEYK